MTHMEGRLAVVTGASSGIGRAIATALADAGCRIVATGRNTERLADVAMQTGGDYIAADLVEPGGVETVVEAVHRVGVPEIVVLSAGIGLARPASDSDDGELRRLFQLNAEAPIRLCAALLPGMRERRCGRLVFVTSIAGVLGVAGESAYASTKGALHAFAESVRVEAAADGVGVTTVVPGVVDTRFFAQRGHRYTRRFPRPIPPERVGRAVVRAIERDRAQVVVPGWLRLPIAVRGAFPEVYARAASKFG